MIPSKGHGVCRLEISGESEEVGCVVGGLGEQMCGRLKCLGMRLYLT